MRAVESPFAKIDWNDPRVNRLNEWVETRDPDAEEKYKIQCAEWISVFCYR